MFNRLFVANLILASSCFIGIIIFVAFKISTLPRITCSGTHIPDVAFTVSTIAAILAIGLLSQTIAVALCATAGRIAKKNQNPRFIATPAKSQII